MTTRRAMVDFILELLGDARPVAARAMFGGYTLYCEGKVVGLICDDMLFVKDTAGARAVLPDPDLGPPYAKAKPHIIATPLLDDVQTLQALVHAIADDLPAPKPKRRSQKQPENPGRKTPN